jgi:hypothetical protein
LHDYELAFLRAGHVLVRRNGNLWIIMRLTSHEPEGTG